jgi:hypothetical protein
MAQLLEQDIEALQVLDGQRQLCRSLLDGRSGSHDEEPIPNLLSAGRPLRHRRARPAEYLRSEGHGP